MPKPERIHRYVKVKDLSAVFPEILLFEDKAGTVPTDGHIDVGDEGAVITFAPAEEARHLWSFESLVVHPLGKDTARVDLRWNVGTDKVMLEDTQKAHKHRHYSYTLCVKLADGLKVYLDPQLVNRGRS